MKLSCSYFVIRLTIDNTVVVDSTCVSIIYHANLQNESNDLYHVNKSSKNTHDGTIIRKEKGRKEKEKKMNNVVNMFINRAAIFDSWMEFQAQR